MAHTVAYCVAWVAGIVLSAAGLLPLAIGCAAIGLVIFAAKAVPH